MKKKLVSQGTFLLGILILYLAFSQFNQYLVTQATIDTQLGLANEVYGTSGATDAAKLASDFKTKFSGPLNTLMFTTIIDSIIGLVLVLIGYLMHNDSERQNH